MSINAFVEVAASVTNISCIAQVTLKFLNYTSLVNSGWLDVSNFKDFVEFSADEHVLKILKNNLPLTRSQCKFLNIRVMWAYVFALTVTLAAVFWNRCI